MLFEFICSMTAFVIAIIGLAITMFVPGPMHIYGQLFSITGLSLVALMVIHHLIWKFNGVGQRG